jgi:choline dehydrogenase-like flavoprotein
MILYAADWPRLLPSDFRVRSLDGVADDWPLTYAELRPYYERTDRAFGVAGLGGDPAYPQGGDPPLPPLPIGAGGLRLARAHDRLGWHWWPSPNAVLSAP